MMEWLDNLREFHALSVFLRMTLAVFLGGFIGLERSQKHRPAGFRTYMLISLGAALTMILSQYETEMMNTCWRETALRVGIRTDVSRFGAQVINGVGFLGAGTILVTHNRSVKGLTTAAGLWASACMGLAIGAGFYECVLPVFFLILFCICILPRLEKRMKAYMKNINIYVELTSLDQIRSVITCLKARQIRIYEVDIERGREEKNPSAVFCVRLPKSQPRIEVISILMKLDGVLTVQEI